VATLSSKSLSKRLPVMSNAALSPGLVATSASPAQLCRLAVVLPSAENHVRRLATPCVGKVGLLAMLAPLLARSLRQT